MSDKDRQNALKEVLISSYDQAYSDETITLQELMNEIVTKLKRIF